jgi:hypothetical protein
MMLFQVAMDVIKTEPDSENYMSASENELDENGEEDPLAATLPPVKPEVEVRFCFTDYRYSTIYVMVMFQGKVLGEGGVNQPGYEADQCTIQFLGIVIM